MIEQTPEQIAQHYTAAMHSVDLINQLLQKEDRTNFEDDTIRRNVLHLQIMLAQPYWTTEDLEPFGKAIKAGQVVMISPEANTQ